MKYLLICAVSVALLGITTACSKNESNGEAQEAVVEQLKENNEKLQELISENNEKLQELISENNALASDLKENVEDDRNAFAQSIQELKGELKFSQSLNRISRYLIENNVQMSIVVDENLTIEERNAAIDRLSYLLSKLTKGEVQSLNDVLRIFPNHEGATHAKVLYAMNGCSGNECTIFSNFHLVKKTPEDAYSKYVMGSMLYKKETDLYISTEKGNEVLLEEVESFISTRNVEPLEASHSEQASNQLLKLEIKKTELSIQEFLVSNNLFIQIDFASEELENNLDILHKLKVALTTIPVDKLSVKLGKLKKVELNVSHLRNWQGHPRVQYGGSLLEVNKHATIEEIQRSLL